MIGTEAQRQFYLAAAGIRMWYAREALPGAAPSPAYDFAEGESEPVSVPEAGPAPVRPAQEPGKGRDHIARLQSLMDGESSPQERSVARVAPEQAEPAEREAEAPVEEAAVVAAENRVDTPAIPGLTLQVWSGRHHLLLATLSEQTSMALQQSLAGNILGALNETSPETLDTLRWPLFNNLSVGLNNPSHLAALLADRLQGHADKTVIVLGDAGDWLVEALGREPDVQLAASLAALAGDPGLKRELWALIKPCRRPS